MKKENILKFSILILSVIGVLFSGYMSIIKFFSKECAFGETCPYVFGIPACYVGFMFFIIILLIAKLIFFTNISKQLLTKALVYVSFLGVLYSFYFAVPELVILFKDKEVSYSLGLPICVLGFIFFAIILLVAVVFKANQKKLHI